VSAARLLQPVASVTIGSGCAQVHEARDIGAITIDPTGPALP
jgi:hypothetical protein